MSEIESLTKNIQAIDHENHDLKATLLSLINDYKLLKQVVVNNDYNSKKRSFHDVLATASNDVKVQPEEAINDMTSDSEIDTPVLHALDTVNLSSKHSKSLNSDSKSSGDVEVEEFLDEKLLSDYMIDEDEELDDDVMDSPELSRTSSPTDDDNSLMMSLTRSTTVSTNNSFMDRPIRFLDLPKFNDSNFMSNDHSMHLKHSNPYASMSSSSSNAKPLVNFVPKFDVLQQDKYNLVNDFLEEKLIDNDLDYYESLKNQDT